MESKLEDVNVIRVPILLGTVVTRPLIFKHNFRG